MKKLIYALRCSSSDERTKFKCVGAECPYHMVEELPEKYKRMADFQKDGKYYVNNCDCDKICMDAADKLEEFQNQEDDGK